MPEDCGKNCSRIASERIRYFTGRYMSARDFEDEQKYFLSRRYLHNRMLHGWGVVCGLGVYPDPNPDCAKDHVAIKPGLALDCCGREIVVAAAVKSPQLMVAQMPTPEANATPDAQWYALLCLCYSESETECAPVLYSECGCSGDGEKEHSEYSRVRESYCLEWRWIQQRDLPLYGWKTEQGRCDGSNFKDDCDPPTGPDSSCSCLETNCPPGHCVPLAVVTVKAGSPIGAADIDTEGRPEVRSPHTSLTRVCQVNWTHGQDVTIDDLASKMDGMLKIYFDRRIQPSSSNREYTGTGINASTLMVQYTDGFEDMDFVQSDDGPYLDDSRRVALFKFGKGNRPGYPYSYLEGRTVYITLKCDFVLDCHGRAVDGDHLRGLLPSGDGVQGGTFESWFRVIPRASNGHTTNTPDQTGVVR